MNIGAALQAIEIIQRLAPGVSRQDAERIAPVIVNQTNNEPVYRSRVSLGAFASILSGAAALLMQVQGVMESGNVDVNQISMAVTAIGGGVLTLWGRWVSRTPIGF